MKRPRSPKHLRGQLPLAYPRLSGLAFRPVLRTMQEIARRVRYPGPAVNPDPVSPLRAVTEQRGRNPQNSRMIPALCYLNPPTHVGRSMVAARRAPSSGQPSAWARAGLPLGAYMTTRDIGTILTPTFGSISKLNLLSLRSSTLPTLATSSVFTNFSLITSAVMLMCVLHSP